MKEYSIAAVFWEDHIKFDRTSLKRNPEKEIIPTLTVGVIVQETDKVLVIASDIERYSGHDDTTYMIILKATVISRKDFGTIKLKLRKPRE